MTTSARPCIYHGGPHRLLDGPVLCLRINRACTLLAHKSELHLAGCEAGRVASVSPRLPREEIGSRGFTGGGWCFRLQHPGTS